MRKLSQSGTAKKQIKERIENIFDFESRKRIYISRKGIREICGFCGDLTLNPFFGRALSEWLYDKGTIYDRQPNTFHARDLGFFYVLPPVKQEYGEAVEIIKQRIKNGFYKRRKKSLQNEATIIENIEN